MKEKDWQTEGRHEHCACADHDHNHMHSPEEIRQLLGQKEFFNNLQDGVKKIQALHEKIDNVLATVDKENYGTILTQKKNVQELKELAGQVFRQENQVPLLRTLKEAEQDYIQNVEGLIHHAQVLKNEERKD